MSSSERKYELRLPLNFKYFGYNRRCGFFCQSQKFTHYWLQDILKAETMRGVLSSQNIQHEKQQTTRRTKSARFFCFPKYDFFAVFNLV
jgi:hypothetical protein